MSLRAAEQVADAVMYEGYVLYPYRASAAKNRFRWQIGLVMPRSHVESAGSDTWFMQTECLVEPRAGARLSVTVRGLHLQQRRVERFDPTCGTWQAVDSLQVGGGHLVTWEEGIEHRFVREGLPIDGHARDWQFPMPLRGYDEEEAVSDPAGGIVARVVRHRMPVAATVRVVTEPVDAFIRVRVRIENLSAVDDPVDRNGALRHSLAGTHTLLTVENGDFVSLLDPPAAASALVTSCHNQHTWPVLIGPTGSRAIVLSSPIILPDYPAVAPESPGDFCDATEIDEMLMLRLQTMTDDEKREARATDPRAGRIIDRGDGASGGLMGSLHGAVRHYAPAALADQQQAWEALLNPADGLDPDTAAIEIGSVRVGKGTRVRLKPSHRADSLDLCLAGRLATVTGVYTTLEGRSYVAVVPVDDPMGIASVHYRRGLFFHPDEIEPLVGPAGAETGG